MASINVSVGRHTDIMLQKVLQHLWSTLDMREVFLSRKKFSPGKGNFGNLNATGLEQEAIMYHAGWCFKRVREDISRSANDFALPRQKDLDEVVTVKRKSLPQLINKCGEDQQIEDKFYFSVKMGLLTFFQYLHSQTDFCLKEYLSKGCGDAIQKTLQNTSVDKYLCELWFQFLLPPSYLLQFTSLVSQLHSLLNLNKSRLEKLQI